MASVYRRTLKDKSTGRTYSYWIVSYTKDKKRYTKSAGKSKAVALRMKKRIEAELQTGKFDFLNQPENISIEVSISGFLGQMKPLRRPGSYARLRGGLAHLQRFLGERLAGVQLVKQLSKAHFVEYQSWRRADQITPNGRAGSPKVKYPAFRTINNELSVFRTWLNWAVTAGHLTENPLSGFQKLKTTDSKPRRVLSRKELARLFQASEEIEKRLHSRAGQTFVWRFLAHTGLRIGELIHLQWDDIDFRRKVIKIQRKPDWDPKTYGREVPFTPGAGEVLRKLRKGVGESDSRVFLTGRGRPYRENKSRDWIIACAKQAGIKDVRGPHDLRHSFITLALTEFNIPVPAVQKIVGHSRLATTQAYLHPTTEFIHSAAQKFEL